MYYRRFYPPLTIKGIVCHRRDLSNECCFCKAELYARERYYFEDYKVRGLYISDGNFGTGKILITCKDCIKVIDTLNELSQ